MPERFPQTPVPVPATSFVVALLHLARAPWRWARWMLYARPIRFTRFGWSYILFSLAVGAAAINTGNNLLYLMLGLLLGFIILSGLLSDSCLWGLGWEIHPSGDFYAGQRAELDLMAQKNGFPGVLVQMDLNWDPEATSRALLPYIARRGRAFQRLAFVPRSRGMLNLKGIRLSTRFPFGLFEKSHSFPTQKSWVVYPSVQMLSRDILRSSGVLQADQPAGRRGQGSIPLDLREFQMGDPGKRIHWKSSAKRGRWMVSEMEEESNSTRWLHVRDWPQGGELEDFISFVASLLYTMHANDVAMGLSAPGAVFHPEISRAHLKNMLTYLALVDPLREATVPDRGPRGGGLDALALWRHLR